MQMKLSVFEEKRVSKKNALKVKGLDLISLQQCSGEQKRKCRSSSALCWRFGVQYKTGYKKCQAVQDASNAQ